MIGRDSADVRDFTADLMLAGGNGLPDLHVSALDPLLHLQDQFAARSGEATGATEASATDAGGSSIASHIGIPSIEEIKEGFKGFVRVTAVVVIGILLVALGAWQLTKE
jgi:hypothetical protein